MTSLLWLPIVILVLLVFRDLLYRWLIVRPMTDLSGRYAAFIEGHHIYRWVAPVLAGAQGPVDVYFAGNSHVIDGIDPEIVGRETGLKCYNLALYSLPAQNAVGLLSVFGRYPRLIFIDFSIRYSTYRYEEHVTRRAIAAAQARPKVGVLYNLADRLQCLSPSLFVPRAFSPIEVRSFQKAWHYWLTGRMAVGRYTPFRPFVGYEWWCVKATNHRLAKRVRPRATQEREREEYLIELSLAQIEERWDPEDPCYQEGLRLTRSMVESLLRHDVRVVFVRLPVHSRVVAYENARASSFYADIGQLALELSVEFIDLTTPEHTEQIGPLEFYHDGHHVCHPGDVRLSHYFAKLVRDRVQ